MKISKASPFNCCFVIGTIDNFPGSPPPIFFGCDRLRTGGDGDGERPEISYRYCTGIITITGIIVQKKN